MAPRGRGGKFSKPTRGGKSRVQPLRKKDPRTDSRQTGGKHFSRNLQPVDKDGNVVGMWREPQDVVPQSSDEESSSEESEEEESGEGEGSEDEDAGPSSAAGASMTREERRAAAKAKKQEAIARRKHTAAQPGDLPPSDSEASEDEDLPANPNHTAKSRSQLQKKEPDENAPPAPKKAPADLSQLSRREREAVEAQQRRERYMKLHAEGKTDEARADLARLALVREQREAEKARKQAEKEEKDEQARERAAAVKEREDRLRQAAMGKPKKGGKK
ncbi:hypothetical protein N7474_005288 [Penicillium riverlandense]|uniref:uncharacterized protein n=1 Tax=Penicillium riverlandense TaxID=1903569 RepID=UPI0025489644|nr:uncharacterized protein N7474_005288 [Penicillium riverlandense]KAJ5819697.1 hypothetical protein N7474_005288 [Penicillium riverlandense]